MSTLQLILFILSQVAFNSLATLLIKYGMRHKKIDFNSMPDILMSIVTNVPVILGGLSFGLAFVFYSLILSKTNVSIAYPIMSGSAYLLIFLFSIFLFKEQLDYFQWLGALLIFLGLIFMTMSIKPTV